MSSFDHLKGITFISGTFDSVGVDYKLNDSEAAEVPQSQ